MKITILHRTIYEYSGLVADSINDARLCPVSDELQNCRRFDLKVEPAKVNVLRRLDFFTNQVHHIEVNEPHERLAIEAFSEVETFTDAREPGDGGGAAELPVLARSERFYDFLAASERIPLGPVAQHEARQLLPAIDRVGPAVERVMAHVYENFEYSPGKTTVESSVSQVIEQRKGVCQDFAHVMIALCRLAGIPTRYVSGYFHVDRPVSGGADDNRASHAWVECYLPSVGWMGYDPTHNRRVTEHYVKVAVGRDYTDVRPVSGTYRGRAAAELRVEVAIGGVRE